MLDDKPWLFDNKPFFLRALDGFSKLAKTKFDLETFWIQLHILPIMCMNHFYGELIGENIGKVLKVDVKEEDIGWGHFLRVRVEIQLAKPLACGRLIKVKGDSLWIPLNYEKLPHYFFSYV